jgi:hypothetical protein
MASRFIQSFKNIFVGGTLILKERPFASLPSDPQTGELANVSDADTATSGNTVGGGSTNHILARFDGSVWKCVS